MNKTILVIDDDDMLRTTLAHGLRASDFYVLTAANVADAEEVLKRVTVDAIVLDRMMVGMDGLSFLKELRAVGNQIPVIMLTAMSGAENVIDGLAGGANDYLSKPFQLRELILRLNNIMRTKPIAPMKMPNGLVFSGNEFFVRDTNNQPKLLALSGEEKKLLVNLTHPVGNIVTASPMVAKRLRNKINSVLLNTDIVTVRGRGYKLVSHTINTQEIT